MSQHVTIPMDTLSTKAAEARDSQSQDGNANQENPILKKTPTPIYRHAAPSGPWPWMDFDEDVPVVVPRKPESPDVHAWQGYPQSLFRNWTETQVKRCKMLTDCPTGESNVYKVDVLRDGRFGEAGPYLVSIKDESSEDAFWRLINLDREENIRVRAVFVHNMTKEVLQMLGAKYEVEPFFFSSSTNWIPSRYQESLVQKQSDHITVVLPFIRVIDRTSTCSALPHPPSKESDTLLSSHEGGQVIDTQSPLYLDSCDKYILQDLLSVHMVRGVKTSTILSYHPKSRNKTAKQLHSLINRTGRSVYWSKIFDRSKDPTCLFLCFLWYAMYEWDEVFEVLFAHINNMEQKVLDSESIRETRDLHILQAHLLYYRTLLEDFRKSIVFVQETPNPAMQDPSVSNRERADADAIMKQETDYMISEIERLESQRSMYVLRLRNVMDLAFASVNIDDSKYMKELTIATVRDSAAMKQISYLTMVFLPANFMSNVFSMNVIEINPTGGETVAHYIEGTVGLTAFAMWVAIALQAESRFFPRGSPFFRRIGWPMFYLLDMAHLMYRRIGEKRKST